MDADRRGCERPPFVCVEIDCDTIRDEDSFHDVFSVAFGFPAFYGGNMNAWIDCMGYLDDPEACMTNVHVKPGEILVLSLKNTRGLKERNRKLFDDIVECAAFVNWRRIKVNYPPVLTLSFDA
jgi:RNAse (barnase) inhibitor barstar